MLYPPCHFSSRFFLGQSYSSGIVVLARRHKITTWPCRDSAFKESFFVLKKRDRFCLWKHSPGRRSRSEHPPPPALDLTTNHKKTRWGIQIVIRRRSDLRLSLLQCAVHRLCCIGGSTPTLAGSPLLYCGIHSDSGIHLSNLSIVTYCDYHAILYRYG